MRSLNKFLTLASEKINQAMAKAIELGNGLIPTFLTFEAKEYELLEAKHHSLGLPLVKVTKWVGRALPYFLEAPARYLKQIKGDSALELHKNVRKSSMYDKNLGLYITSESL